MAEAIIKYLKGYDYNPICYIPSPLPHSKIEKIFNDEDYKWINRIKGQDRLAQMLELAIYLQLQPLIELCAATAAASIRGKSAMMSETTLKDIERTLAPENEEAVAMLEEELEAKYYKSNN